MPRLTKEDYQRLRDSAAYPPRHPAGCPQNLLRMQVTWAYQKGKTVEQITSFVAEQLPKIDHSSHPPFTTGGLQ